MDNELKTHAVVIGGSMTGMLAARVLADHYRHVTIIERDSLPTGAEERAGVPQARHLHVLLARGLEILEELFPGIGTDLAANGSSELHWGKNMIARFETGWTPVFDSHVRSRATSRALLEWLVRCRVGALNNVEFCEQAVVESLVTTDDRKRVIGVRVMGRGANTEIQELAADLVVDASGRSSKAMEWLAALGYGQVEETEINSFLGYATRWYKRPTHFPDGLKSIAIGAQPPHNLRSGVIMELEHGQWVVTLAGANKDYPPTDDSGFLEFARSLMTSEIYDAMISAEATSPIYGYRRTENRLKHFERLERWPEQFVVMGDAACAFNPVYGQGMTAGALEALELRTVLQRHGAGDGAAHAFQQRLGKVIQIPWLMATGEDLRYPGTEGGSTNWLDRQLQKYIEQVIKMLPGNPSAADVFYQVMNLLRSPVALFHPNILLGVAKRAISKQSRDSTKQEAQMKGPVSV